VISHVALLQTAHALGLIGEAARFARATASPERAQDARLLAHLRANAETAYGRAHGFASIDSVRAFQDRVPIVDYEALAPYVDRIARGEREVLSRDRVLVLERTSGSTRENKLIPYTAGLLSDFGRATSPWFFGVYRAHPRLFGTKSYWSLSPVARAPETTSGGIRVGFESDLEYLGPLARWGMERMMAVPQHVARIADVGVWRRATLRALVDTADLGLVSIWSPSFLTLLMDALARDLEDVLAEVRPQRAAEVRRGIDRHGFSGEAIWPRLSLISSWTDGAAAALVPALARYFPRTTIAGKGLLATEGVVSTPIDSKGVGGGGGAVLAVTSHFLEFLDVEAQKRRPLLAHELRVGGRYSPLLTTANGFARYHLKDVVVCTGMHRATPTVRFEGKLDRVTDIAGEKLHEKQVSDALERARREVGVVTRFSLLAPSDAPLRYQLFIESDASDETLRCFGAVVERELLANYHYSYCRDLGQLGAVEVIAIRDGQRTFTEVLTRAGVRLGDIKPATLEGRRIFHGAFRLREEAP
jgi:hypothetical protein